MLITRNGTERVARYAFELARKRNGRARGWLKRVTCVDKATSCGSFALLPRVFDEVGREYPDVEADHLYVDAAAQALVVAAGRTSTSWSWRTSSATSCATLAAARSAGSASARPATSATARPTSSRSTAAPDIAGQDAPTRSRRSSVAAMLLRHCGRASTAGAIEAAVERAFAAGDVSILPSGAPAKGTESVTHAVIDQLRR